MWIGKAHYLTMNNLINSAQDRSMDMVRREGALRQQIADLERENTRMRSDLDWFKLRLNHVELERAQLISAAIGIKVTVPQFLPAQANPEDALNQLPDLSSVGGDAKEDDFTPQTDAGVDYSMLPGYRGR